MTNELTPHSATVILTTMNQEKTYLDRKKILHLFKFDPTGPRNERFTLIIWNESSRTKVHLGFKYLFQHYNLHQTEFETRLPFVSEKIYGNLPDSCGKRFLGEKIDRVSLLQRIKLRFPFIK